MINLEIIILQNQIVIMKALYLQAKDDEIRIQLKEQIKFTEAKIYNKLYNK
jgi:hypothetical protein